MTESPTGDVKKGKERGKKSNWVFKRDFGCNKQIDSWIQYVRTKLRKSYYENWKTNKEVLSFFSFSSFSFFTFSSFIHIRLKSLIEGKAELDFKGSFDLIRTCLGLSVLDKSWLWGWGGIVSDLVSWMWGSYFVNLVHAQKHNVKEVETFNLWPHDYTQSDQSRVSKAQLIP